jgi:hypothetical protein
MRRFCRAHPSCQRKPPSGGAQRLGVHSGRALWERGRPKYGIEIQQRSKRRLAASRQQSGVIEGACADRNSSTGRHSFIPAACWAGSSRHRTSPPVAQTPTHSLRLATRRECLSRQSVVQSSQLLLTHHGLKTFSGQPDSKITNTTIDLDSTAPCLGRKTLRRAVCPRLRSISRTVDVRSIYFCVSELTIVVLGRLHRLRTAQTRKLSSVRAANHFQ